MRTMKSILLVLAVFALFTLTAGRALAGEDNCSNPASCGFGSVVVGTATGTLSSGHGDSASFIETVYYNSSTLLYSYVFTLDNFGATLASANTLTLLPSGDHFNASDSWGVVTTLTTANYLHDAFAFNPGSLTVCFDLGPTGCTDSLTKSSLHDQFTFYAQSANGPTTGSLSVADGGTTTQTRNSLDPAPEPRALVFLEITVLLLAVGIPFADRRLRERAA
jgi:hypothetical protein